MIRFKDILKESEDLDTLVNRKLLDIVAKKFDLNFRYGDLSNPIIDQMRSKGIFIFMNETLGTSETTPFVSLPQHAAPPLLAMAQVVSLPKAMLS